MKFTITIALDVPCYGHAEIEADSLEAAQAQAQQHLAAWKDGSGPFADVSCKPEWDMTADYRIVDVEATPWVADRSAQLRNNLRAIGYEREGTGGGTEAMARYYPAGLAGEHLGKCHVLVTDYEGSDLPRHGEDIVIGLYDDDGEAMDMAALKFNAGRYEVERLDPLDMTAVDGSDGDVIPEPIQAAIDAICVEYQ